MLSKRTRRDNKKLYIFFIIVFTIIVVLFLQVFLLSQRREETNSRKPTTSSPFAETLIEEEEMKADDCPPCRDLNPPSLPLARTMEHNSDSEMEIRFERTVWNDYGRDDLFRECQNDFGFPLINRWRMTAKPYCSPSVVSGVQTEIRCHRLQQTRHTAMDNFCQGTNLFIDFEKIRTGFRPSRTTAMPKGSLFGSCEKGPEYRDGMFPGEDLKKLMMVYERRLGAENILVTKRDIIPGTTYFLRRDGAYNLFHQIGDYINIFMGVIIAKKSFDDVRIVIVDLFEKGPFQTMCDAMAPRYGCITLQEFEQRHPEMKTALLEHVIFHMPTGQNFIWKDIWTPNPCHGSEILQAFTRFQLAHLDLHNKPRRIDNNGKINILLSSRSYKPGTIIGRKITNEDDLLDILQNKLVDFQGRSIGPRLQVTRVDLGTIPFIKQIELVRNTDIYIGMHGAGMTHSLWLPEEAVIIELFPFGWHQSSFRNLARHMGKSYLAWQNVHEQNNVLPKHLHTKVDPKEFQRVAQTAITMVLSFNLGKGF